MTLSQVVSTVGKVIGGLFFSLTGAWLLVICLGALITLGVLSVFHLGVALSLGALGVCLLLIGACMLCHVVVSPSPPASHQVQAHDDDERMYKDNPLSAVALRKKEKAKEKNYQPSSVLTRQENRHVPAQTAQEKETSSSSLFNVFS